MGITNGYATLAQLQGWNQATATVDVANLERAIGAASRGIDQYCNRHFWKVTATARVLDACDSATIELGAFHDLVSIDSNGLKTDDNSDGTFETTWATTDYQLLRLNASAAPEARPYTHIEAIASRRFPVRRTRPSRSGLVQITGTWGWDEIPKNVEQACLMLAARYFTRKESPHGVAGIGEFGVIRVSPNDRDVIALLNPYQLYGVLVG